MAGEMVDKALLTTRSSQGDKKERDNKKEGILLNIGSLDGRSTKGEIEKSQGGKRDSLRGQHHLQVERTKSFVSGKERK